MTVLNIPINPSLYKQAEEGAAKQGQSLVGFVSDLLNRHLATTPTWSYFIEQDDDSNEFIVSDSVVNAYGVGATVDDAFADYRLMLLDMYQDLSANAHRLSPQLEREYQALSLHMQEQGLLVVNQ